MSEMMQAEETLSSAGAGRWKPYPTYKDSGVEWLGEIPEHWEVRKIGVECTVKARLGWKGLKASEYVDDGYIFLSTPDIKEREIDFNFVNHITPERYFESPEIMLEIGDVLIAKDGSTLGITNVVRYLPAPATVNSSIAVIRPRGSLDSLFLHWFLSSSYIQEFIQSMKGGMGVPHLFQADLRKFVVLMPPSTEQRRIARFIDEETENISTLVAKKERLIELLQEKRAALISHAVTKGLNAGVRMRDSGVEWLGEIPEHWEVRRLKFVADVLNGVAKGRDLGQRETVELPYLRVANVQDGYLDLSDIATITVGVGEVEHYSLKTGDVLMNEGGDFDKLGRGYVRNGEISHCLHQNHVFAVRTRSGVDPYWISLITLTSYAKHYFILKSKQSTNLASISATNLKELPVLMPPDVERDEILAYIENITTKIDALIAGIREGIEKLQEYRVALISAAVTGKIDVGEGSRRY